MKSIIKQFQQLTNKALERGFYYIFASSVLVKLIQMILLLILVRYLNKNDYGAYSYALNTYSFFALLSGMGIVTGLLQFSSTAKDSEIKYAYLRYAIRLGIITNTILTIILLIYVSFNRIPIENSKIYLYLMSFLLILSFLPKVLATFFRSVFDNKKYAVMIISNNLFLFAFAIIGILKNKVIGLIFSQYIAFTCSIIVGIILMQKYRVKRSNIKISTQQKTEINRFSIISMITNIFSSLVYLIDIFLLGIIIKNPLAISDYKVATIIPFNLMLLPDSIMMFVYPYFAKKHQDKTYIKNNYLNLIKFSLIINGIMTIIILLFSPELIKLIFGVKYVNSEAPFKILMIGYFVCSSFRIPAGNVLFSINKVKINLINSIISGAINIILAFVLISKYGIIGAALSTTSIFIISSIISNIYLLRYFKNE